MNLRAWNVAIHRDLGFLVVGLTLVYALSGLAVNHLQHWNPSYRVERVHLTVSPPPDTSPEALASFLLAARGVTEAPSAALHTGPDEFKVFLNQRALILQPSTGDLVDETVRPRPLLFPLNALHLNKGRGAWTWIADVYAASLVILAVTGLFIVRGRKGLWGRGGVLVALGVALPILYWVFFGAAP
jgi:hypothetical protein